MAHPYGEYKILKNLLLVNNYRNYFHSLLNLIMFEVEVKDRMNMLTISEPSLVRISFYSLLCQSSCLTLKKSCHIQYFIRNHNLIKEILMIC